MLLYNCPLLSQIARKQSLHNLQHLLLVVFSSVILLYSGSILLPCAYQIIVIIIITIIIVTIPECKGIASTHHLRILNIGQVLLFKKHFPQKLMVITAEVKTGLFATVYRIENKNFVVRISQARLYSGNTDSWILYWK